MQKRDKYKIDRSKKGKEKRTYNGHLFASDLELKYYKNYLLPLKESGEIISIDLQPKFLLQKKYYKYGRLIREIFYVGDFEVTFKDGTSKVLDTKGQSTVEALLKRKMFDFIYSNRILEWISWSARDGGWIDYGLLQKLRRDRKKEKNAPSNI